MKNLKLNLDYKVDTEAKIAETIKDEAGNDKVIQRDPTTEEIDAQKADISKSYIEFAVTASYKDGLGNQFRKLYANIQNKIQEAIESKKYVVALENSEVKFIKDAFTDEKTKFTPKLAMYVTVLEDEIFGL